MIGKRGEVFAPVPAASLENRLQRIIHAFCGGNRRKKKTLV
jgi:hypothetical protein